MILVEITPAHLLQWIVSCAAQILYLEVEIETLTEQLHRPEVSEEDENGRITGDNLDQIQKHNRELEQQLGDKNRVSCFPVLACAVSFSRTCLRRFSEMSHDVADHQAAAAENGRAEEDAAERTGQIELGT